VLDETGFFLLTILPLAKAGMSSAFKR
jgi:hypothetical protein